MSEHNPPRAYDLDDPAEIARLYRETAGYLRVCQNCGGDWDGRAFALQAFRKLVERHKDAIPATQEEGAKS